MGKTVKECNFQELILAQRLDKPDSFNFVVPLSINIRIVPAGSIDGLLRIF